MGIELGGTNYTVAIARPLSNNNIHIADFAVIARKSGITYESPTQSLQEITTFLKAHLQAS